ncbi:hypothetical protein H4R33_007003, partial [Dimargaris cristalligena]
MVNGSERNMDNPGEPAALACVRGGYHEVGALVPVEVRAHNITTEALVTLLKGGPVAVEFLAA